MDLDFLSMVKKTTIKAVFSDNDLMEVLVMKGGNAIDLVYGIALRSSIDLDFSMNGDFSREELGGIKDKIERVLTDTFALEKYVPFDITFEPKPPEVTKDMEAFWGGYQIEFKIIESAKYRQFQKDPDRLRRNSSQLGPRQKKKFHIDISKYEYCGPKNTADLDGYEIRIYTLEMIVFEKLRAICQQMPEYSDIVAKPNRRARARDFFDIFTILERRPFEISSVGNRD